MNFFLITRNIFVIDFHESRIPWSLAHEVHGQPGADHSGPLARLHEGTQDVQRREYVRIYNFL